MFARVSPLMHALCFFHRAPGIEEVEVSRAYARRGSGVSWHSASFPSRLDGMDVYGHAH